MTAQGGETSAKGTWGQEGSGTGLYALGLHRLELGVVGNPGTLYLASPTIKKELEFIF